MQRRTDPQPAIIVHFRYASVDTADPLRGLCDLPRWLVDAVGQRVVDSVATYKHVEVGVHRSALRGLDAQADRTASGDVDFYTLAMLNTGGRVVWRAFSQPNYVSLFLPCGAEAIKSFYRFAQQAVRRPYEYRVGDVYVWPRSPERRGSYCTALVCEALQAAGFLSGLNPTEVSADALYTFMLASGARLAMTLAEYNAIQAPPSNLPSFAN